MTKFSIELDNHGSIPFRFRIDGEAHMMVSPDIMKSKRAIEFMHDAFVGKDGMDETIELMEADVNGLRHLSAFIDEMIMHYHNRLKCERLYGKRP